MIKIVLLKKCIRIHCLSYESECQKISHIFWFRFVPLACFAESTYICMPRSKPINYIVYSVREKTCTAQDRFVYFSDYY